MDEKMISRNISFAIVLIILLVITLAGSTYAYFGTQGETDVLEIKTANLKLAFTDGELLRAKLEPIKREEILTSAAKKTFTVTNTGDEKMFVHISMEDIVLPETLKRFDFIWSLYEGDKNISNGSFEYVSGTSIEVGPYQVLEKGDTKTYNLYVWVEETGLDQNSMMGQIFSTTIKAVGEVYHTSPESDFTIDENGTITSYTGPGGDLIIPETIGGIPVTGIGTSIFWGKDLTSVVIPNNVTYIGDSAFASNGLRNVVIPNNVTYIGDGAFCTNRLKTVSIPNSITHIGDQAFGENNLQNVVIPNGVTYIGVYAFGYGSNQLKNVIIPNSVTYIGNRTFIRNLKLSKIVINKSQEDSIKLDKDWNCLDEREIMPRNCTKYADVIYNPNY